MVKLLNQNRISTVNNSKYILLELPVSEEPFNLLEVIYSLIENNKVPIIAHPERYLYIQKDPNKLIDLIDKGVLLQMNYGSIIGMYGNAAEKTGKILLKNNFIHFLGTDTHKSDKIYKNIELIKNKLRKIISEDKIQKLTEINPNKVLDNKKIEIEEPFEIKYGFFKKFFL